MDTTKAKTSSKLDEKPTPAAGAPDAVEGGDDDELVWEPEPEHALPAGSGVLAGASSVVAAGLGLASITGTWLSTLISQRELLIGQIKSSGKSTAVQLAADYGTPWHSLALVNGVFALVALLVAGAVLVLTGKALAIARPAPWIRAVAWAGLAFGVIGLLIAGAMLFDVFAGLPKVA